MRPTTSGQRAPVSYKHGKESMGHPGPHQVLIIEGNDEFREVLSAHLRAMGFGVTSSASSLSGLSQIIQDHACTPLAGLLLDLHVPMLGGMAVLQELQVRHLQVPVIMMAHAEDISKLRDAVTAGAHDYLVKPIDGELFRRKCLRTFLGQPDHA